MTAVHAALEVEPGQSETAERKGRATFDMLALQQLLAPVRWATAKAQRIQLIASAATVVPFVGIVELGRVLLVDGPVDAPGVWTIVAVVIGALLVRTRGERNRADDHAFRRCRSSAVTAPSHRRYARQVAAWLVQQHVIGRSPQGRPERRWRIALPGGAFGGRKRGRVGDAAVRAGLLLLP